MKHALQSYESLAEWFSNIIKNPFNTLLSEFLLSNECGQNVILMPGFVKV